MKRVISIFFALLLLASNAGFAMNTHFCGGIAVKSTFTIGLHNPDCGMADMDMDCANIPTTEEQLKSIPCCQNQHQILQLDENADIHSSTISTNPVFVVAFVLVFVQPILFVDQTLAQLDYGPPPIPKKDIQVLFQTFLI